MRTHGTCIVGIVHGKDVWMGCDSMASDERAKVQMLAPKIMRVGDMLIGVCGALRIRDVVEFVTMPERTESVSDREYIVRSYIPALRNALREAGTLTTEDGLEEYYGDMLIAYRAKLYSLCEDFALLEHSHWATGSGGMYAMGALYATKGEPRTRIKTALQAACEYSPSCGPPFHIEKL